VNPDAYQSAGLQHCHAMHDVERLAAVFSGAGPFDMELNEEGLTPRAFRLPCGCRRMFFSPKTDEHEPVEPRFPSARETSDRSRSGHVIPHPDDKAVAGTKV
jgi:hypothetical protein